jgi:Zn-dependent protease with chaperone function
MADAGAVELTRNPLGLAGALKRVGADPASARLASRHAVSVGHLFFVSGFRRTWLGLMSGHPSLTARIRLLDRSFDGNYKPYRLAKPPPIPQRPSTQCKTSR